MSRIIPKFMIYVTVGLWFATGAGVAYSADKVDIRAGEHPTYGRLVLDWKKPQKFTAEIQDGFLVIRFPEEFDADLSIAPRVLDDYLGAGSFLSDKKGIRFPLKGDFSLKTAQYGTAIAFDLTKKNNAAAGASALAPKIRVRSGDHATFSRLVVDWPGRTDFSLAQKGAEVVIKFDSAGALQLTSVKRNLPKFLTSVETQTVDGGTEFRVVAKPGVKAKAFRSGNSIAIDFKDNGTTELASDEPPANSATAQVALAASPQQDPKTPAATPTVEPTPVPVEPVTRTSSQPAASTDAIAANDQPEAPSTNGTVSANAAPASPKPRSLIPTEVPRSVEVKQIDEAPAEKLIVKIGKLKDGIRLIFPWKQSTAMALFERSGKYWLAFDKKAQLDFRNIKGPVKFLIVKKNQIAHDTATVASLSLREGYAPSVMRVENEWRVDFRLGEAPVIENTIDIQPQPAAQDGARVFIPAVNNGRRVAFIDPNAGDELYAVPLYSPSWGLGATRTFAQFTILPSVQGIGMVARDSAVKVAVERNGVSVTAEGGLQLTRTISKDDLFASGDQTDRFSGKRDKALLVKLDEWAQVPPKDFWERKQLLQRRVAKLPPSRRNAARLELAKFFVAHEYFADAFGVLERIRNDDPRADDDGIYRLIRGLSYLGMNHLEEAEKDLFHPVFSGVAEVAPWRAMVAAGNEDWKTASREIKAGRDAFGVYSNDLQNQFRLLDAEAALEDFDIEVANKALEGIRTSVSEGADPYVASKREFLEGVVALRSGDMNRAIDKFDQAIALDKRPIVARAKFAKINAQLAQKDITPEEAIDEYRKMEFAWRGDDLEIDVKRRIGDLQIATGQMSEGLKTYRELVKVFPKNPKSRDIAREMSDIFNQLFLEGGAEKLPPVTALALYYEYRELTPLGKKGDQMIRNLADRLIRVDLLDQASQLLDHQVVFRLKGELKSYTGTKLAVVHLWNDKPQESLNTLQKTRWRALPESVKQERLHIRARAHSDLGNYEEALELLTDDKSEKADLLRADIYWKSKNWGKVTQSLQKLLIANGAPKARKLEPIDRQRLMQLAVAMSLDNNDAGIRSLRRVYRKKMVDTPDLDAFDLITEDPDGSETEFRKKATAIAKITQLESFMAGYREQLKKGEFWATN
ncbi:tetratricopeptide repeat protein [Sneathiella aquimaris]|uniref:tetratricopeptide repeat protein n=1 Tax=Sneathiella aquimaris TaxID=2599305 RepID=UPI00146B7916|nr:tetratricopeptide repeat protein [Sneathiella aquimaris]